MDNIERAIQLVTKATQADANGKLNEALDNYMEGSQWLLHVLKFGKLNEAAHKMIQEKVSTYLERCAEIKKALGEIAEKEKEALARKLEEDKKSKAEKSKTSLTGRLGSSGGGGGGDGGNTEDEEAKKRRGALNKAIVVEKPNVKWSDIAGLEAAKEALKEAVILPTKFPHLFTGQRKPWHGILLFGPPGTGKSFIAKAVATEANNSTFFSVSSSDLISKWVGESEKQIKQLFELAREHAPAIIFIDEIDSLCSNRTDSESDSTRRVKTEFLVQMQGVGNSMEGILVLGATNTPWVLDAAIRRRFEKRIYIPLPDQSARKKMLKLHVADTPNSLVDMHYAELAKRSEGYSGHDISVVVREALMEPVRKVQSATHFKRVIGFAMGNPGAGAGDMLMPCSPTDPNAEPMSWTEVAADQLAEPILSMDDMLNSLKRTKPSVNMSDLKKFEDFKREFGQEG